MVQFLFSAAFFSYIALVALYIALCNLEDAYPGSVAFGVSMLATSRRATTSFFNNAVKPNGARLCVVVSVIAAEFTLTFCGLLPVRIGYDGTWLVSGGIVVTGLLWMRRILVQGGGA